MKGVVTILKGAVTTKRPNSNRSFSWLSSDSPDDQIVLPGNLVPTLALIDALARLVAVEQPGDQARALVGPRKRRRDHGFGDVGGEKDRRGRALGGDQRERPLLDPLALANIDDLIGIGVQAVGSPV